MISNNHSLGRVADMVWSGSLKREWVMQKLLKQLFIEEQGTETLEWGLVCGLIVVGAIIAITAIGPKVKAYWEASNAAIPAP